MLLSLTSGSALSCQANDVEEGLAFVNEEAVKLVALKSENVILDLLSVHTWKLSSELPFMYVLASNILIVNVLTLFCE